MCECYCVNCSSTSRSSARRGRSRPRSSWPCQWTESQYRSQSTRWVRVQEPKYKVSQGAGTKVQGESGCRNQSKTLSCAARILCGASWGGGWQSADLQNLQLPFPRTLSEFSLPILRWQAVLFWEKVLSSLVSLFQVMQHRFPLHRISYCADDKSDKRIFTFIAKEADSNKHHCFVFDSEKCVSASGYSLSRRGS